MDSDRNILADWVLITIDERIPSKGRVEFKNNIPYLVVEDMEDRMVDDINRSQYFSVLGCAGDKIYQLHNCFIQNVSHHIDLGKLIVEIRFEYFIEFLVPDNKLDIVEIDEKKIKYNSVYFKHNYLNDWLKTHVKYDKIKKIKNPLFDEYNIKIEKKLLEYDLKIGKLSIDTFTSENISRDNTVSINSSMFLCLKEVGLDFDQLISAIDSFQYFFNFCFGKEIYFNKIDLEATYLENKMYVTKFLDIKRINENNSSPFMLIREIIEFEDIKDSLNLFLDNWFKIIESEGYILSLYFSNGEIVTSFFNQVTCLEYLVNDWYPDEAKLILTKPDFKSLEKEFKKIQCLEDLEKETKSSVVESFHYINRLSFKNILVKLFNENEKLFSPYSYQLSFPGYITKNRNGIAHADNEKIDMKWIMKNYGSIKYLNTILILKKLQLDESKIIEIMEKSFKNFIYYY